MTSIIKQITSIAAIAIGLLFLASCSGNNAKQVAEEFLQAYYIDHNFEKALNLTTENTRNNLSETVLSFASNPFSKESSYQSFVIEEMDVNKSVATCYYEVDSAVKRKLLLRRDKGHWLVDMPAEVMQNKLDVSLSLNKGNSGGFASGESEWIRLGDVPEN